MKQDSFSTLHKRAQESYRAGRFPEAAGLFEQLARHYSQEGDGLNAAEMANNRSVALLQSGDAQGALEAAEGTDQVFAQAGDARRQALALGNQAAALEGLQRLDEALGRYWQSADLLKQVGDVESRAVVLKNISTLQLRTGHQLEALASMDAALGGQKKLSAQERFLKKLLDVPMRMLKR
jgi:tetratricopeptide (TPR) repeat protein